MSNATQTLQAPVAASPSRGLWALAWQRLRRSTLAMVSLVIVLAFFVTAVAAWGGLIGAHWKDEVGVQYAPPTWFKDSGPGHVSVDSAAVAQSSKLADAEMADASVDPLADDIKDAAKAGASAQPVAVAQRQATLPFGGDQRGRDVLQKLLKGSATSLFVGFTGAILAILIGTVLGALSGYFGGWVDDILSWFYSVFTSIPDMLLLLAFAAVSGRGLTTVVLVLALTSWTRTYRLVRAEFLKHKVREYVRAADAIGCGHGRRMFVHILPNVTSLLLVQFSVMMVDLIKFEVILSYLGFGVGVNDVSWGSMLGEVPAELMQGYWWQLAAVALAMSVLVTAFSLLTDALRDALDPKLK